MLCSQWVLALAGSILAVYSGYLLGRRQASRRALPPCPGQQASAPIHSMQLQLPTEEQQRKELQRTIKYVHCKDGKKTADDRRRPPVSSSQPLSCGPEQYSATQPHMYVAATKSDKSGSILFRDEFLHIHHPNSAVNAELVMTREAEARYRHRPEDPYGGCSEVYLIRTGIVRYGKPNKCSALVQLAYNSSSAFYQSHRVGESARLVNMYQDDYLRRRLHDHMPERDLVGRLIDARQQAIHQLIDAVGDPVPAPVPGAQQQGSRRALVVLVANDGVMDFVLNFACSCRAANLSTADVVVYVGGAASARLVRNMDLRAIFSPGLGGMPDRAANNYGDASFAAMMWLKVSAVYVALAAGFDVLFQDTDVVWFRDPVPFLRAAAVDTLFMDDGARTIRFTPYFANSGFYFLSHNARTQQLMERMLRSASELAFTHSHQSTFTRYLTESQHLCDLDVTILDKYLFPSGDQYHNDKPFLRGIAAGTRRPFVFHMSFTATRDDKVRFFRDIGQWHLAPADPQCANAAGMLEFLAQNPAKHIADKCCAALH